MKTFWECPRCMKLNFSRDTECFVCRHVNPNHPNLVENLEAKLEDMRRKIGAPPSLFAPFGGAKKPETPEAPTVCAHSESSICTYLRFGDGRKIPCVGKDFNCIGFIERETPQPWEIV